MRERPETLNEALQLACQYQGVEELQKRLQGVSAKAETMAVGKEDDSESESEAVAAITNAKQWRRKGGGGGGGGLGGLEPPQ